MSTLTHNDQVMAAADDPFDLADVTPPLAKLLQPGTPELASVAGATLGGFVIPDARSDEPLVYGGLQGFLMQSVAFSYAAVEWAPTGGRPVASHPEVPADAKWFNSDESADGKAGYVREINGNAVVPTIYAHGVLFTPDGGRIPMTQPCAKTSYAAGREWANRAQKLRVKIEGEAENGAIRPVELRGPTVGLWQVASVKHTKGSWTWFVLSPRLIGKIGDPGGPSLDDWRLAMQLRDSFKKGGSWPLELLEPPAPPAIEAQPAPSRSKPIITSGRPPSLRAVETVVDRETAPPIDRAPDGPGEFDEPIPF